MKGIGIAPIDENPDEWGCIYVFGDVGIYYGRLIIRVYQIHQYRVDEKHIV
jgi:hypothetical protein